MRPTLCLITAAIALAVLAGPGACQTPDSLFNLGCDLYEKGEFAPAAGAFERVKHAGVASAAVYYNLGNTYYRLGSLGKAVANYRRAHMLDPRNEDVEVNLVFVRTMVGTRDTLAALGVENPADIPLNWVSPRELQAVFFIFYYLAMLSFLVSLLFRGDARRNSIYALIIFVVLATGSFALSSHAVSRFDNSSGAVVTSSEVELRSGPGNAFERIATLRDGVEVRLKSSSAIWVEVQLPTGEVGWLRDNEIERI